MELKCDMKSEEEWFLCSNRTFMELKLRAPLVNLMPRVR